MVISELVRRDALPEYIRYHDTGCELHSACLTCPLPVCKEELSHGRQSIRARMRGMQINLLLSEGRSVGWIAKVMGISERTVYRTLESKNRDIASLTDRARRAMLDVAAQ